MSTSTWAPATSVPPVTTIPAAETSDKAVAAKAVKRAVFILENLKINY
jgi:hypothetical protein